MADRLQQLAEKLEAVLGEKLDSIKTEFDQVIIEVSSDNMVEAATSLRDHKDLQFQQCLDVCGIDYSQYNNNEWQTDNASATGFSRAVNPASHGHLIFGDEIEPTGPQKHRFAAIYQLISYALNWRLTLRVFAENDDFPMVDTLVPVWNGVDWFEREAFDLFGIHFKGHPDLRRILTDYGFVGHPFRKDFPLAGHVEMRYDEEKKRVVYEPVSIEPRVLVPRVHREDHRYIKENQSVEEAKD